VLDLPITPLPAPVCVPTPLEAVEPLVAPHSGVLVFLKKLGDRVEAKETVAEIVNPVTGQVTPIAPKHAGVFFARTAHRHLLRGMHVCKIAGATAFRAGDLLGS
jgi:predicted deacylase